MSKPAAVVKPDAEVRRERIPFTPQQQRMISEADAAVRQAQQTLNLILSTICAGAGIADARLLGIEGGALVVEVAPDAK